MALEALRSALAIVSVASEASRERAADATEGILGLPGVGPVAARAAAVTGQFTTVADEILAAAVANRSMVADTLRAEADLQLQRFGLITTAGVASAQEEIDRLQAQVSDLRRALAAKGSGANGAPSRRNPAPTRSAIKSAAAQRPTAGKSAYLKPVVAEAAVEKTADKRTVAKKTASTKAAVKKTAVKKATAPKPVAKKAPAKRSTVKKAVRTPTPETAERSAGSPVRGTGRSADDA